MQSSTKIIVRDTEIEPIVDNSPIIEEPEEIINNLVDETPRYENNSDYEFIVSSFEKIAETPQIINDNYDIPVQKPVYPAKKQLQQNSDTKMVSLPQKTNFSINISKEREKIDLIPYYSSKKVPSRLIVGIVLVMLSVFSLLHLFYSRPISSVSALDEHISYILNDCLDNVSTFSALTLSKPLVLWLSKKYILLGDEFVIQNRSFTKFCRKLQAFDRFPLVGEMLGTWIILTTWYIISVINKKRTNAIVPSLIAHIKQNNGYCYLEDIKKELKMKNYPIFFMWRYIVLSIEARNDIKRVHLIESRPFWSYEAQIS